MKNKNHQNSYQYQPFNQYYYPVQHRNYQLDYDYSFTNPYMRRKPTEFKPFNKRIDSNGSIGKDFELDFKPADTGPEFYYLVRSNAKDLIRSIDDYKRSKPFMPFLQNINRITMQEFEDSLVFNNGGYASSYYGGIAKVLSYKDFSELYARFGLSMKYFYDGSGYKCDTCVGGGKDCQSNSNHSCSDIGCGSC